MYSKETDTIIALCAKGKSNMPRTAPTVDGTPLTKLLSFKFVDRTGDLRSISARVLAGTTNAQIEALAVALAAATQANLWAVEVTDSYNSVVDKTPALTGTRDSVFQNIAILIKSAFGDSANFFIPAPVPNTMNAGTDDPNASSTETAAVLTALLAAVNEGIVPPGEFEAVSLRYSERREVNNKVVL